MNTTDKKLILDAVEQQPESVRFLLDAYGITAPHSPGVVAEAAAEYGAPFIADLDDLVVSPWLAATEAGPSAFYSDFGGMAARIATRRASKGDKGERSGFINRIRTKRASQPSREDRSAARRLRRDRPDRRRGRIGEVMAGTLIEGGAAAYDVAAGGGGAAEASVSAALAAMNAGFNAAGSAGKGSGRRAESIDYMEAAAPGMFSGENKTLMIAGIVGSVLILAGMVYISSRDAAPRKR